MQISQIEVKTTYHLQLSSKDLFEAFTAYLKDETAQILHKKAFNGFDEHVTMEQLRKFFDNIINSSCSGDLSGYLASYFGYDGWSCGIFKHKDAWLMTAYNNGKTI